MHFQAMHLYCKDVPMISGNPGLLAQPMWDIGDCIDGYHSRKDYDVCI